MPFGRFRTHSPESSASRPDSLHNSTNSTKDGSKAHLPPLRTSTQSTGGSSSSTSDEPTSPRSSTFSTRPLSRLHAAVSRGASTSSASSSSIVPPASEPTNPVQLAEAAISLILTVPGPSIEELRNEYFPKLFHEAYSHRANTREHGLRELENLIKRFRSKFESMRVRFRSHIVDQDGTATMDVAAVGLTYDIIAVPHHHHHKGEHRRDVEERRTQVMAIIKIYEGRLAQTDIVLDTVPFHDEHSGPQLNQCAIM